MREMITEMSAHGPMQGVKQNLNQQNSLLKYFPTNIVAEEPQLFR